MELQDHDIALLEAYLAGELQGDALLAAEARIASEPELAEMLDMLRALPRATQATAQPALKRELQIAKAAAVAAGMSSYTPAINQPPPAGGGNAFGRLLRFLITLGVVGGAAWAIWKYVLHEQWPPFQAATTKSTKSSHIQRDTVRHIQRDTVYINGPGASQAPHHAQ